MNTSNKFSWDAAAGAGPRTTLVEAKSLGYRITLSY